ncbi:hypothetical protein E0I74_32515 [Rhizobium laguerreae]|uniref:Uncharacterized protein n=1 Tax=Rhizobium laguerreae TaxID=1076926 RepID=A0A1S9GZ07_9HYPH|nr:hypothetical protein [Rhizobium laguerreae]MBB3163823.1 hypothetical protein [Rhizobium laguerreae]MBY3068249.1 hypothetical protein [Rhizobium laguerreae]MBY3075488.1 hypothetical protein [Rhizobium laguerreae]MBY3082049.1 hypothetical protein [Rhizobium laguerreae]MBY3095718.1 hypothetical protein [Rhizobium laguerreae]
MFVFILKMPVAAQTAMPEGVKNMPDSTTMPTKHASLATDPGQSSEGFRPHKNGETASRQTGQPDEGTLFSAHIEVNSEVATR